MRITILLLFISSYIYGQNNEQKLIKFNGIYETKCNLANNEEGGKSFLRFYPNQKVICVGTVCDATVFDLRTWFNLENKDISVGNYKLKNNRISFTTTSSLGTVKYNGRICKNGILKIKIKSLINGYNDNKEYKFKEQADLK